MSGSAGRGWIEAAAVVRDLERKGVSVRTEPDADGSRCQASSAASVDTTGKALLGSMGTRRFTVGAYPTVPAKVLPSPGEADRGVPSDTWLIWKGPVGTFPGTPI